MSNTYTCEHCGGVFEKGWSDEEADAEYKANFTYRLAQDRMDIATESRAMICDDCYKHFMEWFKDAAPTDATKLKVTIDGQEVTPASLVALLSPCQDPEKPSN